MARLLRREPKHVEPADLFDRLDRMFDEWKRELTFRWPMLASWGWMPADMIPIDEYQDDGTLVVRAELPGINPETDLVLTVSEGGLHIEAERRVEEQVKEKGYVRHEVRCGSFARTVALPEGVTESDISANYKNGILEIRIPAPELEAAKKIPVATT